MKLYMNISRNENGDMNIVAELYFKNRRNYSLRQAKGKKEKYPSQNYDSN